MLALHKHVTQDQSGPSNDTVLVVTQVTCLHFTSTLLGINLVNVQKNSVHVEVLLVRHLNNYDIIFIQEPLYREIYKAPSSSNIEGEAVIGAPMHPEWLYLVRPQKPNKRLPRVMAYVSKRLSKLRPSMRFDLVNHPDILAI